MANPYEMLVILPDTVRDEALTKAVDKIRDEITKLGGIVDRTDLMGRRTFAHPLKRRTSGQYVRLDFHLDPSRVDDLSQRLKLHPDVFRFQVVKAWPGRARAAREAGEGSDGQPE